MSGLEKKREDFHKYLESVGVVDNLTRALIKLYEQKNKPQDASKFLRRELCLSCHDEDEYEYVVADLEMANKRICQLEREIASLKGSVKRTASEVELALTTGFEDLSAAVSDESMLKQLLTRQIFDELKELKTSFKGTLLDCIQAGFEKLTSSRGIFACDPEAYSVFSSLFNPLIERIHEFESDDKQPELDWGETCQIPTLNPQFVRSVEISVSRNVVGYPFAPIMKLEHYEEILEKLSNTVKCMCSGDLKGKLYHLEGINEDARKALINEGMYFRCDDDVELKNANATRFWPQGRAIFANEARSFFVWCNQQDHFKFIARDSSGNLRAAYELLIEGINRFGKSGVEFVRDERLGFVTFAPHDLGTGMHASIQVELDGVTQHRDKFDATACELNLRIEKIDGCESDKLCTISNEKCLGVSEFETIKALADGVAALIDVASAEECL